MSARISPAVASRRWRAIGTTISVLTEDPRDLDLAEELLRYEVDALDIVCSRFRDDSELEAVHRATGTTVAVSPLLTDLVATAVEVARLTGGLVDPTVGSAVVDLGYDRDFDEVERDRPEAAPAPRPAPGWRCVELDTERRTLRLPPGVRLDLGATAKAFAADEAASQIAAALGCGVLVNLGGDIAVAGDPPEGGWRVGIDAEAATPPGSARTVVAVSSGGVASSGTGARTWRRGGRLLHHIVDPRTGDAADTPWRLVTVAAESCTLANAASTAAVAAGAEGLAWLVGTRLPARLESCAGGSVLVLGGWPTSAALAA